MPVDGALELGKAAQNVILKYKYDTYKHHHELQLLKSLKNTVISFVTGFLLVIFQYYSALICSEAGREQLKMKINIK
ncbi:hypothetical protein T4B_12189 [Trichinella pseudospiralis]|uniref:Uncharacterized protein n=1 Tax=Trichinella pseudospiralis TaxID=6337 RepID=A0A0V1I7Z8_TRIPS|nr:hypothetical protein T4A_569 [Trichinella pseudospiralis]KRZ18567.1 hypothetical protein T4B_12189 [Trichinella pseudospiralis]KRZ38814.1 hypothetical protein T4C_409 [Trichinella pseudospiralis]